MGTEYSPFQAPLHNSLNHQSLNLKNAFANFPIAFFGLILDKITVACNKKMVYRENRQGGAEV